MTIALGTRVGAYEIVAAIAAGGMGEVYRTRDTKLGRDVAIAAPDAYPCNQATDGSSEPMNQARTSA